jgi:hypothetical protein
MLLVLGGVFLYQRYADRNAIVSHPHYNGMAGPPRGWDYGDVVFDDDARLKEHLRRAKVQNGPDLHKPMIWLHVPKEWNARRWAHFFERGSYDLNQPYMYMTIKSIADRCGDHFNIAVIDDDSFASILPNWDVDMGAVGDPVKGNLRQLALARILHTHGGMVLPPSTVCVHSLIYMHKHGLKHDKDMYVGQFVNDRAPAVEFPSKKDRFRIGTRLMGCAPKSAAMLRLVKYLEMQYGADPGSSEAEFVDRAAEFCAHMFDSGLVHVIDGRMIGTRTAKDKAVDVHHLMGDSYVEFDLKTLVCIHVPHEDILAYPKYQWFAYLNVKDALDSNTLLGDWLTRVQ